MRRPIFLIVDRGSAHVSKATKAFVESLKGKIRLFYLPPYSPHQSRRVGVESPEESYRGPNGHG
ncbi:MAG: transposase, partial [Bryobacteraceae bacterium]